MVKPIYFYGSYLGAYCPPPWIDLTDKLTQALRAVQEYFPAGLPLTNTLSSYIIELPLKKIQEDIRRSVWNVQQNMPYLYRYLLIIADQATTFIGDLIQAY